jgi:sulfate permease, SulP family
VANFVTGFIGGMGGCAMIGQSVINVKSGGRNRLSSFLAGVFLLFLIVVLGAWVKLIPMAALVAIMIMVSIGTFSWASIVNLKHHPRSSSVVMLATVAGVVFTHNLAIGVLAGVLLSGLFFAWKVAQIFRVTSTLSEDGTHRTYVVEGQLFFASGDDFLAAFDFKEALNGGLRALAYPQSQHRQYDHQAVSFRFDRTSFHGVVRDAILLDHPCQR